MSNMDPQQLVQEFNSLPRTPKTPSGQVDNHWQFAVHHVAFEPSGDLLYMINPGSLYIHSEGPAQITSLATVEEQAELIVPMLLEAFVSCMGMRLQDPRTKAQGPWSWGTEDEKLAKALERRLRAVGVREELCEVKVGDEESIKIEKKNWDILLQKLEEANGPRCSKCNGLQRKGEKLLRCGGCRMVKYCSKKCQKSDWKEHKIICQLDAVEFWRSAAPHLDTAQKLAAEIGLKLGSGGIKYPVRRLIITGKDTPSNLAKFFGRNDSEEIEETHKQTRIEVLLNAPPGSPDWALAKSSKYDEGCPAWTPRLATAEEEAAIKDIRDMQEVIKRHMGDREMKDITTKDMMDVLAKSGTGWLQSSQLYTVALNAMDQGVQV